MLPSALFTVSDHKEADPHFPPLKASLPDPLLYPEMWRERSCERFADRKGDRFDIVVLQPQNESAPTPFFFWVEICLFKAPQGGGGQYQQIGQR